MVTSPTVERAASPGLFVSLRSFFAVMLSTASTRFDLATLELEEQALFVARVAGSALAAVLCLSTAFFFLMMLIVVIFWQEKELAVGIILGVYLFGALVFAMIAKTLIANRPKLLEQTLAELRKDADALRKPIVASSARSAAP